MVHLIVQLSKYLMILLFLIYTFLCFYVFRLDQDSKRADSAYALQRKIMYLIHGDAFLVLYLTTGDVQVIGFYLMQLVLFCAIFLLYKWFYANASRLLLNNMCMLLCIGMIVLTRLSFEKAFRQFLFMIAGLLVVMMFPVILSGTSFFRKLTWLYAGVGIAALAVVMIGGTTSYGAKLSLSIMGFSIQPSEFVKIIFVFFVASMLYQVHDFRQVVITSMVAAVFVLVLVASRDLGSALLYFFTYLAMVYVATRRFVYFGGGFLAMSAAAVVGYFAFSHVQTRVIAWKDPLAVIDNEGYQVCQSLFAIGTGGWFGLGLNEGMPKKIPVVEKDVIFSAISEEFGGIFAVCLIMVCISCFLIIFNISMQLKDKFYRLVALGLGSIYAMQVFLTIGGVTKFIPSTGVTLPLVSYGGSSLLSTMIIFGIIQALYVLQADIREHEQEEALAANVQSIMGSKAKGGNRSDGRKKRKQKKQKKQK